MSEIQKLAALRANLVVRRRALVERLMKTPVEQLTGDTIARIQAAIDAVDRASADEQGNAGSGGDDSRRRAS
ncbi:MAG TPA: hypothetical protein VMU67_05975 [Steroidobacteraceae bacterium]|nr:hypothetical protein [Steroidobacteraceae bacterium]